MTSLPDRIAQLFKLVLSSNQPGEVFAAAGALNRALAAAGYDIHSAGDAFMTALVSAQERPKQLSRNNSDDDDWLLVRSVTLYAHRKASNGWPSIRVEYLTRTGKIVDWWAIEHGGHARDFAHQKWRSLGGGLPLPDTVDEAVERQDELAQDVEIQVDNSGRYPQIIAQRMRQVPA